LNSEWFIGCLDIGHAYVVDEDPASFIESLGANRLQSMHLHDVDGINDNHTLPYQGKIDWESVMRALARIGYTGELNYEAVCFLEKAPSQVYRSGLCHMVEVGRYLISRFEAYQKEQNQA